MLNILYVNNLALFNLKYFQFYLKTSNYYHLIMTDSYTRTKKANNVILFCTNFLTKYPDISYMQSFAQLKVSPTFWKAQISYLKLHIFATSQFPPTVPKSHAFGNLPITRIRHRTQNNVIRKDLNFKLIHPTVTLDR